MWKRIARWYLDLPVWSKFLLSSFASALTGASVLVFLSTYATYSFAFPDTGARIPVEELQL